MDAATLTAIVAVPATVVSVGSALWATVKQRRTEDASITLQALTLLLATYQKDNEDLRGRVTSAESRIGDLREQVAHCEADKAVLQTQLNSIQRQIDDTPSPAS